MVTSTRSRFATRVNILRGEGAIETLARAQALERQGRHIIHLEIGEPDFDTPPHIVEAAIQALHHGYTHYTPAPGIRDLRSAVAAEASRSRNIPVSAENVVITPGAKPIVFFVLMSLIEPGDEVILPDPGYPAYSSVAEFAGAKVVPLPLCEERQFRFSPDDLRAAISPRSRMLIINSPQNPTGSVLNRSDLEGIAAIVREHNLWVLTDEVYRHLVYDSEFYSIASLPGMLERTIILDGVSKSYAMTGWRLGYVICPPDLAEMVTRFIINTTSCTATFVQHAAIAALKGPQEPVAAMATAFRKRRDLFIQGLNRIPGWKCEPPAGAFYAFPNIKATGLTSQQMADYLLDKANVAALPGNGFGDYGEGYVRLCYANSEANLQKAIDRIHEAVSKL